MREQAAPVLTCDLCKRTQVPALATVYSTKGQVDVKPYEFVGNLDILAELCPECWSMLIAFLAGDKV